MNSAKKTLWAFFLLVPFLLAGTAFGNDDTYDDIPEVTAKVARVSFINGEAQIRRSGSEEWERVTKNLPIVEGDEIATERNSRIEIQFDTERYLRLDENAYLKMTSIRDEGISVSLPQGTLLLRVLAFDKDRSFFEIDAPRTTVAVQKAGMYRIDAGQTDDTEIRVTVTEKGQARVYSENSGFTLKDGRSAKVFIAGSYAGEWDIDDASRYVDGFSSWSIERDTIIAKKLREASYDKYYDRDFYGAEDLNENGEWIYTRDYGHVWRPYSSAIRGYDNWSPYRYGTWRWIPPYGWTWVNAESWGWATYHHGRWIHHGGHWVWTPYGQYRSRRSWWRPALVVISYIGNSICWYPLPYQYRYYNYNRRYNVRNNTTTIINNNTTIINNNGNPTNPTTITVIPEPRAGGTGIPPLGNPGSVVPGTGVIAIDASEFGRGQKNFRTPSPAVIKEVLSKVPDADQSPPLLPNYKDLNGNVSSEILVKNPKFEYAKPQVKTGAGEREIGNPLDEKLRQQKVYGNRDPIKTETNSNTGTDAGNETRGTGAVIRTPPVVKRDDERSDETVKTPPTREPRGSSPIIRSSGGKSDERNNDSPPIKTPRPDRDTRPPYTPPVRTEEPRQPSQPRKVDPPRETYEPRPQPRVEPRPQPRVEPRPQPKVEPKSEPKSEESRPSPSPKREKP